MPRPKVKDYKIVPLSMDIEALEILDRIRGSFSRTEFIEMLIKSYGKEKAELLRELEELKKENERLKKEIEDLRMIIETLKQKQAEENIEEQINNKFEELKQLYKQSYNKWQLFGDPKAKAYAVLDVIDQLKKQGEIDEITKKAIEKLLDYAGLSKWKNEIDKLLER